MEEAKKLWMVKMSEELYTALPAELRAAFEWEKVIYDDYNLYKDDPAFIKLNKAKREATKALDTYKWNKRYPDAKN